MSVLVVDADGFLGAAVAAAAREVSEDVVQLLAAGNTSLRPWRQLKAVDFREQTFGLDPVTLAGLAGEVTHLVVTAGGSDPGCSWASAHSQCVLPVRATLAFARKCRELECVVLVSSLTATGQTKQRLRSSELPAAPRHRTALEWAAWESERVARVSGLPVRVVRAGHVFNATNDVAYLPQPPLPLQALPYLASGWPVPVLPDARCWCAPVDFVAEVVVATMGAPPECPATWAIDPRSPTYGELLDMLSFRHGIHPVRVATRRGRAALLATLRTSWIGFQFPREVLQYWHAAWDLDLSCLKQLLAGSLRTPPDRSYVARTIDLEMWRRAELG